MMRFLVCCLLFFGSFFASKAQSFKAGAAVRIITPDPLLPVSGGIGTPHETKEKNGDLFARAFVLEKGGVRIAIVSVDNLGWSSVLGDRSRKLIKDIPAENIIIGATHTHSAPDAYGFPDEKGKSHADLRYLDWCVKQIADAVNEATANLEPASLKSAVGEARGKISYNYYAPQLYDPRCGVIQAVATSGKNKDKVIATLVNYAVHPEVLGSGRGILSPDLCGPLYQRIESKAGGMAMFMNGAQGGMVTADVRLPDGGEANTWEECVRIGTLLGDEALRIIGDAPAQADPMVACTSRSIKFPVDSEIMRYILKNSPLKMATDGSDSVSTRLNYLQLGTARVLTIPGEALPNIGYYLKRKMKTQQPFLFGLTNDAFGYILTEVDFNSFKRYDYVSRTSLGEMTGEIYIKEVLGWLEEINGREQKDACCQAALTPQTALDGYLGNGDTTFKWELKESYDIGSVKAYSILLTSQRWHEYVWTHQLTILVPAENKYDGALLFINGGSNRKGVPNWNGQDDDFTRALSAVATKNKGIVTILRQTPNQPLVGDLTEDALISYTLHQFKEDGDYSWPLLFPMVKSAVRAMDAVQEFSSQVLKHKINRFVVSGASKRGWTTWLTGASDARVAAIAPMVIDILNMPVNLDYQVQMWKDYSVQIEDYVTLGIPQTSRSEKGMAITTMVDPYSYRKKLSMPKMIFMGTNDEYWTVDAIKHYIDSIPGQNFINYVPNVGHSLGDKKQALTALSAFFGQTLAGSPYPVLNWNISQAKKGATLKVDATADILVDAILWSTDSEDTDFRDEKWSGKSLGLKNKKPSTVTALQPYPEKGYRAFYLDLKYKDANGGEYTESTRMFVADNDEVFVK